MTSNPLCATFWRNPAFTAVAVVTLALGIGANTAIFSIADALLFRPVDLKNLDCLVAVSGAGVMGSDLAQVISPADYFRFRDEVPVFDQLAAYHNGGFNLRGKVDPEVVNGCRATVNLFEVLRVNPAYGRAFLPEEGEEGRGAVVILGDALWQRAFGGDPAIVGQVIEIDGVNHEVIGIMPPRLSVPPGTEMWLPYTLRESMRNETRSFYLRTVGRLKQGISRAHAEKEVKAEAARLEQEWPDTHTGRSARVDLLREQFVGLQGPQMIAMLMGAVAFVLLIACVNVAMLQLARLTSRARERAIRAAIGASRVRLIGQALVESMTLGLAGALLAIIVAHWGVELLKSGAPPEVTRFFPNWDRMGINRTVLVFLTAVGVLSGIVAGLIPAILSTRLDLNEALKSGARHATGSRSHHHLKSSLIVAQFALAVVLLVGATLLVRGMGNIASPNPAISARQILRVGLSLSPARYDENRRLDFTRQLMDHLESRPEVESVGLVLQVPYSSASTHWVFYVEGRPKPEPGDLLSAQPQLIDGAYLEMLKIKLRAGRTFTDQDHASAPKVCLVSESLVRRYFPGDDALGRRIHFGSFENPKEWWTIVGITEDILHSWEARAPRPTFYLPFAQETSANFDLLVQGRQGDAQRLARLVQAIARELDPRQPLEAVMTLERLFNLSVFGMSYLGKLMATFGILALILSATGIYSVIAFAVTERKAEIAVRMALGAEHSTVLWLSLRRAVVMMAIALPVGVLLALGLGRAIASLVYGVAANDPAALGLAVFTLTTAGLAAAYVSARRALSIEPMEALRNE